MRSLLLAYLVAFAKSPIRVVPTKIDHVASLKKKRSNSSEVCKLMVAFHNAASQRDPNSLVRFWRDAGNHLKCRCGLQGSMITRVSVILDMPWSFLCAADRYRKCSERTRTIQSCERERASSFGTAFVPILFCGRFKKRYRTCISAQLTVTTVEQLLPPTPGRRREKEWQKIARADFSNNGQQNGTRV